MFDGIEVDVLDIGDADCIIVTRWVNSIPHRVLIDGGCGAHAEAILEFLLRHGFTNFWAVVCTHLHNDHARGLIKLVRNPSLTIHHGWMHNINKHVSAEALRRASGVTDGVKEVRGSDEGARSRIRESRHHTDGALCGHGCRGLARDACPRPLTHLLSKRDDGVHKGKAYDAASYSGGPS